MALRKVRYNRKPTGPGQPTADILQKRQDMDLRGSDLAWDVEVVPHSAGPGKAEWIRPQGPANPGAILFLHGSGFSKGSPSSHRQLVARIVACSGIAAFVPDYRLTPEHRFPAALEDALGAYREMLRTYAPGQLALVGDSAGGWRIRPGPASGAGGGFGLRKATKDHKGHDGAGERGRAQRL